MTDETRIELDAEDRAIEQALSQAMATGSEPRLLQGGEDVDPAQVREYTELLGLLPYELAPQNPAPNLKQEILNRVRSGSATADSNAESANPLQAPVSPAAWQQPASVPAPRRAWGNLALAAGFAACLLGLGFVGGLAWQQSQEIDQLNQRLATAETAASPLAGPLADQVALARQETAVLRDRLEMITVIARQAYPMRPVSHSNSAPPADGIVYVCGQHQRWYLSLQGLEPAGANEEYRLWFMTENGRVDGGVLEVDPDRPTEMDALSMPQGVRGFAVTLESVGPRAEPESLTILLGENAIKL